MPTRLDLLSPVSILRLGGACWLVTAVLVNFASGQTAGMVEFFSSGKLQKGLALVDLAHETVVLGRDGQLHSLDPRNKMEVRKIDGRYQPLSATELRNRLRAEFGRAFEVVATNNFLVVQPKGRGDLWPDMFEQSHRSFTTYMSKRGVKTRHGRFPMVAVVFPDERSMYAEFRKLKLNVSRVSGLYSNNSNRVMTHDGGRMEFVAATVRHEAAHQSAFNYGVHSRLADTPRWITEGIGQMFEPAAMTETQSTSNVQNRVNRESMYVIAKEYEKPGDVNFDRGIVQLIGDNEMFARDSTIDNAYALSWAMMFYLAERDSKAFAKLLNLTANRPAFKDYSKAERLRDFEAVVGVKPYEFSRRVRRYLESLKS
tara:strand:- start:242960 stop:244069 length:1110 start_codon:yes stop_codon:yes gene_type:complete